MPSTSVSDSGHGGLLTVPALGRQRQGIPGADWIETSCWWAPVPLRCCALMGAVGVEKAPWHQPWTSIEETYIQICMYHFTKQIEQITPLWEDQPPQASVTMSSLHRWITASKQEPRSTLPFGRCFVMVTRILDNTPIDVAVTVESIFAAKSWPLTSG